jgi:uncharacterized alkaline shock family protein YloU
VNGTVSVAHAVVARMVRRAAVAAPGVVRVARGGPAALTLIAPPAVAVRERTDGLHVRITVVARPGHDLRVVARDVRDAIAVTVERLLGLELAEVTVVIDGVGE